MGEAEYGHQYHDKGGSNNETYPDTVIVDEITGHFTFPPGEIALRFIIFCVWIIIPPGGGLYATYASPVSLYFSLIIISVDRSHPWEPRFLLRNKPGPGSTPFFDIA